MGLEITKIGVELSGLKIEYSGLGSRFTDFSAALSGPAAGLLFYFLCLNLNPAMMLSGQLSLTYSLFNLLPILPLDGGRAVSSLFADASNMAKVCSWNGKISRFLAVLVCGLGLFWQLRGEGGGLFAAGMWLLLMQEDN